MSRDAAGGHAGGPLERITVHLTARSSHALDVAAELTGDTKTDTINRALQVYAFLQQADCAGTRASARAARRILHAAGGPP